MLKDLEGRKNTFLGFTCTEYAKRTETFCRFVSNPTEIQTKQLSNAGLQCCQYNSINLLSTAEGRVVQSC